jgi:hypothetical protein
MLFPPPSTSSSTHMRAQANASLLKRKYLKESLMGTVEEAFAEGFRAMEEEMARVSSLSPSLFDVSRQLGVRSAGPLPPASVAESSEYMPRTPSPLERVPEEGETLPLEDNSETEEDSTDTQLSSHAEHPGYPYSTYNPVLHGAPVMIQSSDQPPVCGHSILPWQSNRLGENRPSMLHWETVNHISATLSKPNLFRRAKL